MIVGYSLCTALPYQWLILVDKADIHILSFLVSFITESYNWSLPEGYNKTGTFWMYGDSVTREMFFPLTQRPLCTILYQQCRLTFTWMYPRGPEQSADAPDDNLDFQQDKIIGAIVKILRQPEMQTENSTLVINIGHHAATILNFTTFQKLIGDLIYTLKETSLTGKNGPKFKAKIIWKSATAAKKMKRTAATAKFDLHENPNSLFLTTQVRGSRHFFRDQIWYTSKHN